MNNEVVTKELNDLDAMLQAYPIIRQRYLDMSLENYAAQTTEMIKRSDFKMIAAYLDDEIVGIAGYSIQRMLYCGRFLQISSFIVDGEKRGHGIGRKILAALEEIAKKFDCDKIVLDSYVENKKSHPLYLREGFHIRGFHFMKDLA